MKYLFLLTLSSLFLFTGCEKSNQHSNDYNKFLTSSIPNEVPIRFKPEFTASNTIIHRGIFSNDLNEYYFAISDTVFSNFTIKVSIKQDGTWSKPVDAFFNSGYNDHGMSFSPDGNILVFSSTRPVTMKDMANTWHLWQCVRRNGEWSQPKFIDIPNLRSKLLSHPTLSNEGTLYFHSSELDYSSMAIYFAKQVNGKYQDAEELKIDIPNAAGYCTPYISSNGEHLVFAAIGKSLDLYFCKTQGNSSWSFPVALPNVINQNGQGNPYLTPDGKFLFYSTEDGNHNWNVNWVKTTSFLKK